MKRDVCDLLKSERLIFMYKQPGRKWFYIKFYEFTWDFTINNDRVCVMSQFCEINKFAWVSDIVCIHEVMNLLRNLPSLEYHPLESSILQIYVTLDFNMLQP